MSSAPEAPESGEESTDRKSGGRLTLDQLEDGDRIHYTDPRDDENHDGTIYAISKSGTIRVFNGGYVDIGISEVIQKIDVAADGGQEIADDLLVVRRRIRGPCPHQTVRRYGRTDAVGGAIIEERCLDCGRTLSDGGGA